MTDQALRFVELLHASGRKRAQLNEVRAAFDAVFPHLRGSPGSRAELAAFLSELARTNILRLPGTRALYDRLQTPELPKWVQLEPDGAAPASLNVRDHPWHPDLAFVTSFRNISPAHARDLLQLQAFLSQSSDGQVLTERERSLQIFGDEKRLEALATGQLFGPGRLNLSRLGCRRVAAPFVHREVGSGTDALIVENKDTFYSTCQAVAEGGTTIRSVIFGAGKGILASIAYLDEWDQQPSALWYFGDLDAEGLRIPVALVETCSRLERPISLSPAVALYEALAERSASLELSLKGTAVPSAECARLVAWLPESLRSTVQSLLSRAGRWPQEALPRRAIRSALLRLAPDS